jgi:hypothetical protein
MFSQDEDPEEETTGMGVAFSGGPDPQDGDEQTEAPSPAMGDEQQEVPEVAEPDAASAYASSPEEQEQGDSGLANEFSSTEDGEEEGSAQYSQPAAPVVGPPTLPGAPVYGDWSADRAALEQQYAREAAQNTKPSIGRRIGAALAGGAVAFGSRNPAAGMKVAEDVNSAPLRNAQAGWARQEAPLKQQLANDQAQDAQTQRTWQGQRQAANDAALNEQRREHGEDYAARATQRDATIIPQSLRPVDPKNPLGEWQGTDVKGRVANNLGPPTQWLNSPAGKAAQAEKTISDAAAAGHPFTKEQEQVVRSGGKLTVKNPTNIHVPSAEAQKYQDWKTQFQKDNQRPPNAAEIAGFGHTQSGALSKSLSDRIEATKGAAFSKAQDLFNAGINKPDEYQGDLQSAQDEYEQRIEDATGQPVPHVQITVDPKTGAVNWGNAQQQAPASPAQPPRASSPAPAPAQAAPAPVQQPQAAKVSSGQTVKVGDPITHNGRTGTVAGFNAQGKIIPKWN